MWQVERSRVPVRQAEAEKLQKKDILVFFTRRTNKSRLKAAARAIKREAPAEAGLMIFIFRGNTADVHTDVIKKI